MTTEEEDNLTMNEVINYSQEEWLEFKNYILSPEFPFIGEQRMKVEGLCRIACGSIQGKFEAWMRDNRREPFDLPNTTYELAILDELMPVDYDIFNSWYPDLNFGWDRSSDKLYVTYTKGGFVPKQ